MTTRTAIVTGGASGIGLSIAERLARDGLLVATFDRDDDAADTAAASIVGAGGTAMAVSVDVSDRSQVDAGVEQVCDTLGEPTVLVNNAGLDGFDRFLQITEDLWNRI